MLCLTKGHGPCGHNIAEYVSNELLNGLNRVNFDRESAESVLVHEFSRIQESMKDLKLKRGPDYEADESGTTASVVLLFSDRIVCANVGDSAIMIVRESEGENTIEQLSENHRPENPEERERIEKCGGRVDKARNSFGEFIGPHRVYMQDLLVPGLMLSRSLGDCFAHTLGVISDPFIKTVRHTPLDRALIVASDGIWDTISTQEVTNCILNVQANGSPAQSVVQSAKEKNATDNLSAAVCMLYSPRSRACLIL